MSDKLYIPYTVARHTNENNMKLHRYIGYENIKAYLVTYTN